MSLNGRQIMLSPPPTPSPELPSDSTGWRFENLGTPCEWIENYRPGGYHPVELGDTFRDRTYKVIRKLGDGAFSTVWLAVDSKQNRYVALKIMVASVSESTSNTELCILESLSQKAAQDPNSRHVIILHDTFIHDGPNGRHRCLVFEPMGPTVASMVDVLPQNKSKRFGKTPRYPKWMAKKIIIHALRGLAFLHQNNVVHGDVQPGNLLFSLKDISAIDERELAQDESKNGSTAQIRRLDGKTDKWAPKNLYVRQSLEKYTLVDSHMNIKVSDFGAAFWANQPPRDTVTPISLRAPEVILRSSFSYPIDIWAMGCLMFEFLTGRALFMVFQMGHDQEARDSADDDHLVQLNDRLGKLPDHIMAAWPRASKWYGPNHERLQPYMDENSKEEPYVYDSLEDTFASSKSDEIDDAESAVICSLIRQMLNYSAEKRPSASELLKHPWFSE